MNKIEELKIKNQKIIRNCFYDNQVWTKIQLSEQTGISKTLTTNIIKEMREKKEILYSGEACSTGGRKSKQYILNKDYYHIGKVILKKNVSSYSFIISSVNLSNEIVCSQTYETNIGSLEELIDLIDKVIKEDQLISILCISIPGVCLNGIIDICDINQFTSINIKNVLEDKFKIPVITENDVNSASIGYLYKKKDIQHLTYMYQPVTDYIGCGMVVNNQLYNGYTHFAGELRYLPFYTHQKQDEMLKKEPEELLRLQIETMCCVINPEVIVVCSDVLKEEELVNIKYSIPHHHLPQIEIDSQLYQSINDGLYRIGINYLKEI